MMHSSREGFSEEFVMPDFLVVGPNLSGEPVLYADGEPVVELTVPTMHFEAVDAPFERKQASLYGIPIVEPGMGGLVLNHAAAKDEYSAYYCSERLARSRKVANPSGIRSSISTDQF